MHVGSAYIYHFCQKNHLIVYKVFIHSFPHIAKQLALSSHYTVVALTGTDIYLYLFLDYWTRFV